MRKDNIMDIYELQPNDPRLGRKTAEKVHWPELDITGAPYERPAPATRDIGADTFVVIPVNFRGEIILAGGEPVRSIRSEVKLAGDGKPMALPEFAPVKPEAADSAIADSSIPALRPAVASPSANPLGDAPVEILSV